MAYPVCIWGVGPAGSEYLRDLGGDSRFEIVGLINRSPERREAVSRKTGVPGFADLDDCLAGVERRPEVVIIATANPTHCEFACRALEAGCHVFCEKTMGMDEAEGRRMLAAEKASGRILQIGFEYRYGTMTARLRELLDQGFFGELTCLDITDSRGHWWPEPPDTPVEDVWRLNRAKGGGPIPHCGIHELDLLRYYGGEIERLQAFVPPKSLAFYPDDVPDHVKLEMRYASGAAASFTLYHTIAPTWYRPIPRHQPDYHAVPGHHLDLIVTGRQGSAYAEIYAERLHLNRFDVANRETVYLRSEDFGHQHPNASHHNTPKMIAEFCVRMRDGLPALDPAEDAFRTTRLGRICEDAVQEAIAAGWASSVREV